MEQSTRETYIRAAFFISGLACGGLLSLFPVSAGLFGTPTEPSYHVGPQWEPPVHRVQLETTGYSCPAGGRSQQCDRGVDDGRTASNTPVHRGVCAADWGEYPVGTWFYIPGYGPCRVEDRGRNIHRGQLDLYFDHTRDALRWGRRIVTGTVFHYHLEEK